MRFHTLSGGLAGRRLNACAALVLVLSACGRDSAGTPDSGTSDADTDTDPDTGADTDSTCVGWLLDETNTGLAGAGIDRETLPLYEPPAGEIQYGTWWVPAGTIITERRIEVGGIVLSAGDITFERCWFRPASIGQGMPLFHHAETAPVLPNTIRDCDIDGSGIALNGDGTNPACGGIAVNTSNVRIERCNIRGFGSGVGFSGDQAVGLECTYIHDLAQGEWFLGSGQSHQDGVTIRGFGGPEASIRDNRIVTNPASGMATGPVFLQATWEDSFFDNILVEGNLLEGYGYGLVLERDNGEYGTNLRAIDNRFNPYDGWYCYVERGPGWAEWRDNHRDDPSEADHAGEPVEEPMTADNPLLEPPSDLVATPSSGGTMLLSWADNSDAEVAFRIGRSLDGVAFTSVDMAGADATAFEDTGLAPDTTYTYRIAAANGDGMSGYSNTASATTSP